MIGRAGVAVAGTHGKSTTIAMLGHTLISAGLDPSAIVGATVAQPGGAESDSRDGVRGGVVTTQASGAIVSASLGLQGVGRTTLPVVAVRLRGPNRSYH